MPRGINRGNGSFRNGTALVTLTDDGTVVTTPRVFGNEVTWSPSPSHFGDEVTWSPSPTHYGNSVDGNPPPFIETVSPASGTAGTAVTITGTGFLAGLTVMFGYSGGDTTGSYSAATSVVVVSQNEITCVVPAPPDSNNPTPPVNIIVTNTDGSYGFFGNSFTY